ncbi:MAG: S1 RNA-binding domain-containing protein [Acutalibacteraceae bacterium]
MSLYYPEGWIIDTPQNRAAMANISTLTDACHEGQILEGRALICDSAHNLIVDLGCMKGIIPREDSAIGIREGNVRDIAIISRVNSPVCFMIVGFQKNEDGSTVAILSRRMAQEKCMEEFISALQPGDIVNARVTHLENFGAFADIGCGIISLLPIDAISISRIDHPKERFYVGMDIRVAVNL